MSIALVQSASTNQTSGSSLSLAFSTNVTGGNAIIVAAFGDAYDNSLTISDGVNTYTALAAAGTTASRMRWPGWTWARIAPCLGTTTSPSSSAIS